MIGGFFRPVSSSSAAATDGRLNFARIETSFPPGTVFIFQSMASCSGAYVTLPIAAFTSGATASGGTGSLISTCVAFSRGLNCVFRVTVYSTRDRDGQCTWHVIHNSGLVGAVMRYVMRSKVPSGGMKEMVLSVSNRASRTHW